MKRTRLETICTALVATLFLCAFGYMGADQFAEQERANEELKVAQAKAVQQSNLKKELAKIKARQWAKLNADSDRMLGWPIASR